jgi:hypothetical protein
MRRRTVRALLLLLASCAVNAAPASPSEAVPVIANHPVVIVTPLVLQGLPMGPSDSTGTETVTPCATCHTAEDVSSLPEGASGLVGPHAGLTLQHGSLRCAACHEGTHRHQLHLADGRSIPLVQAMCHGPQKRDYDHGAHGGMRGYWDLSRGPRERNHCVACHDPHAPAFGKFAPVQGPRDRFLSKEPALHD